MLLLKTIYMKKDINKKEKASKIVVSSAKTMLQYSKDLALKATKSKGLLGVALMIVAVCAYHINHASGACEAVLYLFANNGRVSGRMGGDVKMRNGRSRGFTVPSLVRNAYTSAARSLFAGLSSSFRSLSPSEIASWNNALGFSISDRFAQVHTLKGKQLYISLNSNLSNTGQPLITVAPIPTGILPLPDQTLTGSTVSTDTLLLGSSVGAVPPLQNVLVYATAPLNAGISRPSQSAFRLIRVVSTPTALPVELIADYTAKFGSIVAGSKIFVQTISVNETTGEASAITQTVTLVA